MPYIGFVPSRRVPRILWRRRCLRRRKQWKHIATSADLSTLVSDRCVPIFDLQRIYGPDTRTYAKNAFVWQNARVCTCRFVRKRLTSKFLRKIQSEMFSTFYRTRCVYHHSWPICISKTGSAPTIIIMYPVYLLLLIDYFAVLKFNCSALRVHHKFR